MQMFQSSYIASFSLFQNGKQIENFNKLSSNSIQLQQSNCSFFYLKKYISILCWVWPQPVCLGDLSFRNSSDKMPIVTPAHPQQNSTHNVTSSSFNVIEKVFKIYLMTIFLIFLTEMKVYLFTKNFYLSFYQLEVLNALS